MFVIIDKRHAINIEKINYVAVHKDQFDWWNIIAYCGTKQYEIGSEATEDEAYQRMSEFIEQANKAPEVIVKDDIWSSYNVRRRLG